jgi:hypothetical protein
MPRRRRWERPDEFDHRLLLSVEDPALERAAKARLSLVPGRRSPEVGGSHPRFRIAVAHGRDEVRRRATSAVTAAAIDLSARAGSGRLTLLIERNEEEAEAARGRLAQLSGDLVLAVPGFRPLHAQEDVLPFREAARRYLLASAQLFAGDARGLAKALGVSYFALRRLLARYAVPFPGARPRR